MQEQVRGNFRENCFKEIFPISTIAVENQLMFSETLLSTYNREVEVLKAKIGRYFLLLKLLFFRFTTLSATYTKKDFKVHDKHSKFIRKIL